VRAPEVDLPIAPVRWDPIPIPNEPLSFVEGIRTMTTAGDAGSAAGMGTHVYLVTRSMRDEYFYNADGELLIVPQQGGLRLWTEFGIIDIAPGEIAVIPRGIKMRVELRSGPARGYVSYAPNSLKHRAPSVFLRATSSRQWLPTKTATRRPRCSSSGAEISG